MKPKLNLCLALVLSGGLFGCETSSSLIAMNKCGGHNLDDISSHIFGIEGKVVRVRKTSSVLESISVELIKPLPTALGYIPYEKPGEIIVIHYDEPLSKSGGLQLAAGSIVKVAFGNGIQSMNLNDWGSNFSWLYVESDGHFYNSKGEIVISDPNENL
jgi:hypothetical protein